MLEGDALRLHGNTERRFLSQTTVLAETSTVAFVELRAVGVGRVAVHSRREVAVALAVGLHTLREEVVVGDLEVVGAAGRGGLEGLVVASGGRHSVHVERSVVEEVEALLLVVLAEHHVLRDVQLPPVAGVVGALQNPARRMARVAVAGADESVVVDGLSALVVERPGELDADALLRGHELGVAVVVERLVAAHVAFSDGLRGASAVLHHVHVVEDQENGAVEGVDLVLLQVLVELERDDVLALLDSPVQNDVTHDVRGRHVLVSRSQRGVVEVVGHVETRQLRAVEVDDQTGSGHRADLHSRELLQTRHGELLVVVRGHALRHREAAGRSLLPRGSASDRVPVLGSSLARDEVRPLAEERLDLVLHVEVVFLAGHTGSQRLGQESRAVAQNDRHAVGAPAGGVRLLENQTVLLRDAAHGDGEGGVADKTRTRLDHLARRQILQVERELLGAGLQVENKGELDHLAHALLDLDCNRRLLALAEVVHGGHGEGSLERLVVHAANASRVGVQRQALRKGGVDGEGRVVRRVGGDFGEGGSRVTDKVAGSEGELGDLRVVQVFEIEVELRHGEVVGGVLGDLRDGNLVDGVRLGDSRHVEAVGSGATVEEHVGLGLDQIEVVVVVGAEDRPLARILGGSVVVGHDAVLVEHLSAGIRQGDDDVHSAVESASGTRIRVEIEQVAHVSAAARAREVPVTRILHGLRHQTQNRVERDGRVVRGNVDYADGEGVLALHKRGHLASNGSPIRGVLTARGGGGARDGARGEIAAIDLLAVEVDNDTRLRLDGELEAVETRHGRDGEGASVELDLLRGGGTRRLGESGPGRGVEGGGVPVVRNRAHEVLHVAVRVDLHQRIRETELEGGFAVLLERGLGEHKLLAVNDRLQSELGVGRPRRARGVQHLHGVHAKVDALNGAEHAFRGVTAREHHLVVGVDDLEGFLGGRVRLHHGKEHRVGELADNHGQRQRGRVLLVVAQVRSGDGVRRRRHARVRQTVDATRVGVERQASGKSAGDRETGETHENGLDVDVVDALAELVGGLGVGEADGDDGLVGNAQLELGKLGVRKIARVLRNHQLVAVERNVVVDQEGLRLVASGPGDTRLLVERVVGDAIEGAVQNPGLGVAVGHVVGGGDRVAVDQLAATVVEDPLGGHGGGGDAPLREDVVIVDHGRTLRARGGGDRSERAVAVDAAHVVRRHQQDRDVERLLSGSRVRRGMHFNSELNSGGGRVHSSERRERANDGFFGAAKRRGGSGVRVGHVPRVGDLTVDVADEAGIRGDIEDGVEGGSDSGVGNRLAEIASNRRHGGERCHLLPGHRLRCPLSSSLSSGGVLPAISSTNHHREGYLLRPLPRVDNAECTERNTADIQIEEGARRPAITICILHLNRMEAGREANLLVLCSGTSEQRIDVSASGGGSFVDVHGLFTGPRSVRTDDVNLHLSGRAGDSKS